MTIMVKTLDNQSDDWDNYVKEHPQSTLYHMSGWKEIIEKSYSHKTYYLMAVRATQSPGAKESGNAGHATDAHSVKILKNESKVILSRANRASNSISSTTSALPIVGVFPLVQIKHMLFGNNLISIPYLDFGGILADGEETEHALLNEALRIAHNVGAETIELRNIEPLETIRADSSVEKTTNATNVYHNNLFKKKSDADSSGARDATNAINMITRTHKVRMLKELPDTSEKLMKSFKSKLRSQIQKPLKDGLTYKIGGSELLDDFYQVFTCNMRDLGSPVHSKRLMEAVLETYPDSSKVIVVFLKDRPLAGSFVIGFADTLENPWASSLRKYSKLAPNMLLYWAMLKFACGGRFRYFDFGRSTPDEGTFKFKKQWGAKPVALHWHYIHTGSDANDKLIYEKKAYTTVSRIWSKLPVPVTKFIGPHIRKYISL